MAFVKLFSALALQVIAFFLLVSIVLWVSRDGRLDKIDGPEGNMFVGLGLSLPQPASKKLREWAQHYGEIYKIKIGWYHWVVLSTPEAIKEVFDKQSISCSSKMPAPIGELVVGRMRMLTMPYGPKWRAYRTLVHHLLTPKMVQSFVPVQELEVKQLMFDLANKNFNDAAFYGHLRRALFSIMMTAVYGKRIDRMDHEDIRLSQQSGQLLGKLGKAGTFWYLHSGVDSPPASTSLMSPFIPMPQQYNAPNILTPPAIPSALPSDHIMDVRNREGRPEYSSLGEFDLGEGLDFLSVEQHGLWSRARFVSRRQHLYARDFRSEHNIYPRTAATSPRLRGKSFHYLTLATLLHDDPLRTTCNANPGPTQFQSSN